MGPGKQRNRLQMQQLAICVHPASLRRTSLRQTARPSARPSLATHLPIAFAVTIVTGQASCNWVVHSDTLSHHAVLRRLVHAVQQHFH